MAVERWSEDELKRTLAIADGIDAEGFGATAGTLRDLVFEIRRLRTTNREAVEECGRLRAAIEEHQRDKPARVVTGLDRHLWSALDHPGGSR